MALASNLIVVAVSLWATGITLGVVSFMHWPDAKDETTTPSGGDRVKADPISVTLYKDGAATGSLVVRLTHDAQGIDSAAPIEARASDALLRLSLEAPTELTVLADDPPALGARLQALMAEDETVDALSVDDVEFLAADR